MYLELLEHLRTEEEEKYTLGTKEIAFVSFVYILDSE